MDLSTQNINAVPASKSYTGVKRFTITAGKTLKIETSPNGETIHEGLVPAGKSWSVTVTLGIIET